MFFFVKVWRYDSSIAGRSPNWSSKTSNFWSYIHDSEGEKKQINWTKSNLAYFGSSAKVKSKVDAGTTSKIVMIIVLLWTRISTSPPISPSWSKCLLSLVPNFTSKTACCNAWGPTILVHCNPTTWGPHLSCTTANTKKQRSQSRAIYRLAWGTAEIQWLLLACLMKKKHIGTWHFDPHANLGGNKLHVFTCFFSPPDLNDKQE